MGGRTVRSTADQALQSYYSALHDATVPKTIEVKIERPVRDATVGAAAGILLLLFIIGLGIEIEVPENAPPLIGAEAYAQLQATEPARKRTGTSQGETWKTTKPA